LENTLHPSIFNVEEVEPVKGQLEKILKSLVENWISNNSKKDIIKLKSHLKYDIPYEIRHGLRLNVLKKKIMSQNIRKATKKTKI
jgi:hypothetical protein